jgi:hypothetical protein
MSGTDIALRNLGKQGRMLLSAACSRVQKVSCNLPRMNLVEGCPTGILPASAYCGAGRQSMTKFFGVESTEITCSAWWEM